MDELIGWLIGAADAGIAALFASAIILDYLDKRAIEEDLKKIMIKNNLSSLSATIKKCYAEDDCNVVEVGLSCAGEETMRTYKSARIDNSLYVGQNFYVYR